MSGQEEQTQWTLARMSARWTTFFVALVIFVGMRSGGCATNVRGQDTEPKATEKPTANAAAYVGLTKCATCHFDQYKTWKTSAHGKAFEILPTKYRQDAECLKCHTTGYGHKSGFKDASNANLAGVSCEVCHGPGGEHVKNALMIVDKGITEEGMNRVHSSIERLAVDQCIKCHVSKAHKMHPQYDRDESVTVKDAETTALRSKNFFGLEAHVERPNP